MGPFWRLIARQQAPALRIGSQRFAATIKMPSLSPTMTSGTIVKWHKAEGDEISPGDVLCEVQTDKAVVAMEHDDEAVMAKIVRPESSGEINVGEIIAVVAENGEDWKEVQASSVDLTASLHASAPSTPSTKEEPSSKKPQSPSITDVHLIGPATRLLLDLYNIDVGSVTARGPRNSLMKSDVLDYIKERNLKAREFKTRAPPASRASDVEASAPAGSVTLQSTAEYSDIELSNMRKVIAKRLSFSKATVPHEYITTDIDVDDVLALRKKLKDAGDVVTVNDFIIKAVAVALRAVPAVNVQYESDRVVPQTNVDVNVAVATPSGLITPIVHNADLLGLSDISQRVRDLSDRAKKNKLQLHEFQGGTFTVSNLGMMGVEHFTAIINPPQCAIMAIGGTRSIVTAVRGSGVPLDNVLRSSLADVTTSNRMRVTLCYDARAIDSANAARFLQEFTTYLSSPDTLLAGALPSALESDGISDETLMRLL